MFVAKMSDDPFLCSGKPASQMTLEERTRTVPYWGTGCENQFLKGNGDF